MVDFTQLPPTDPQGRPLEWHSLHVQWLTGRWQEVRVYAATLQEAIHSYRVKHPSAAKVEPYSHDRAVALMKARMRSHPPSKRSTPRRR